jgi:hypothetical protein
MLHVLDIAQVTESLEVQTSDLATQCRCVRIISQILTEYIQEIVTSCTTADRHITGLLTITATDIEYECFRHMLTDIFTLE